jgi:hypothetical protein
MPVVVISIPLCNSGELLSLPALKAGREAILL